MPCSPNDVSFNIPDGPSGPSIPGFGSPFSLKLPNINPFPDSFPENLLDLLDKFKMLIPPGILKPALNPNFGKDIFDAIMKLLDQFMPYLMMYKFFLPILKIILCIIEVLCAIKNPFKLIRALKRLFRNCLPDFLNLFPLWALIIMIISLLLLLLALIEYIINEIIKFIKMILRNLKSLYSVATDYANSSSILAIAKKIGSMLCIFQNLFVLLAIFNIIINIFRDILSLIFAIPPCDDSDSTDANGCCTPDVCPTIVKTDYTRNTGKMQYYNQLSALTTLPMPFGNNPFFTTDVREESWQIYDLNQSVDQAFINIVDGYDIPQIDNEGNIINTPKPIFFPTDVTYTANTSYKQAAYTIDLRAFYNPINWGRYGEEAGLPRYVRFKNCIALAVPTKYVDGYSEQQTLINNGVFKIAGGFGYEDDGKTILNGYSIVDGVTPVPVQANLGTFFHKPQELVTVQPSYDDGYLFSDLEYTFKPNREILLSKDIITSGCIPDLSIDRIFIANVIVGDAAVKLPQLSNALKVENGFPDPNATQECLSTAISALRNNLTVLGVAQFQAVTTVCLNKLKDDTNKSLGVMVGLGFDPCKSSFTIEPQKQFTSKSIKVSVDIKERNGYSIASNLVSDVSTDISHRIKPYNTFGDITSFNYDGYSMFTADITSKVPGKGQLMISFDDNIFCTNTLPTNIDEEATHTLQVIDYQFIYTPSGTSISAGDDTGKPRRDEGDMARDGGSSRGK